MEPWRRLPLLGRVALGRMERRLQREIVLGVKGFDVDTDYADRHIRRLACRPVIASRPHAAR